jgi:hypothetical protein
MKSPDPLEVKYPFLVSNIYAFFFQSKHRCNIRTKAVTPSGHCSFVGAGVVVVTGAVVLVVSAFPPANEDLAVNLK